MTTARSDNDRVAYSPSEVASRLGVTRQHIHNLIARGEIPSVKLGRRRLIPGALVDRFYDGPTDAPAA
jgi:excisionase family DNA binding protein